jgi:hypothetical protein
MLTLKLKSKRVTNAYGKRFWLAKRQLLPLSRFQIAPQSGRWFALEDGKEEALGYSESGS